MNSSIGISRSPRTLCATTRAPSAASIEGGSEAKSASATTPPTVAWFLTRGLATTEKENASAGQSSLTTLCCSTARCVAIAPSLSTPSPASMWSRSATLLRATRRVGARSFWFMTIPRKEPPATMVASSPCSARRAIASSSEVGSCHSGAVVGILVLSLLSLPRPGSLHRSDGPGLEKKDLLPDDRPLDVLRDPVLVLESPAELAELQQLLVREHAFADDLLALELPLAVQCVMIRGILTGDDLLSHAPDGLDDHPVAATPDRVHGEDHAGLLGIHHLLHDDGHAEILKRTLLRAVEESAFGEEGRPAVNDPPADLLCTLDEEVGLLLPGVARRLGVLGNGGGPHGDLGVAHPLVGRRHPRPDEVFVSGRNLVGRRFAPGHELLQALGRLRGGELQHPLGVQRFFEHI